MSAALVNVLMTHGLWEVLSDAERRYMLALAENGPMRGRDMARVLGQNPKHAGGFLERMFRAFPTLLVPVDHHRRGFTYDVHPLIRMQARVAAMT